MRSVERSGRTVEEAVASALAELGVDRSRVEVEVLDEGRPGLFGLLGARKAVVRVTVRETRAERVARFLQEVCRAMGVEARIQTEEAEGYLRVTLSGRDMGLLIGRHGQTLDALQFLANAVANKVEPGPRVLLDVEGYRQRREETLQRLARRLAERVRRTGQRYALEPMPAQERRIIHLALAGHPYVTTVSEGEEPHRRVVLVPRRPSGQR
ncbi:MAG: RNA-binding cell elongation regulator Jag/EloR [Bacillota bacterium]|nr:MAG: protein jag [Bacillota bacterium]